jgi:Fe2+ transport system protein B
MILRRIKEFFEDLWYKVTEFFGSVLFFLLFVLVILVVLSPIIIPAVIGYAVFAVASSDLDPVVRGIVFAVYSAGLFLYGMFIGAWGLSDVKKEVKEGLDMCEKKVLSILDDMRRFGGTRRMRASVEAKIYDFMLCMDAVRKKL